MSDPVPSSEAPRGNVDGVYHLNLAHQEVGRIMDHLDTVFDAIVESAGSTNAWLPVEGARSLIERELGYEDEDHLESALDGSFEEFVKALPHYDVCVMEEEGSPLKGQLSMRIKAPPPPEERQPFTKTLKISKRSHLWEVIVKAPDASIEIPEIEFEFGASKKRQVDCIYNFLSSAIFNLSSHVKDHVMSMPDDTQGKIMETVSELGNLLDLDRPWTIVVRDPSGVSYFANEAEVETKNLDKPLR